MKYAIILTTLISQNLALAAPLPIMSYVKTAVVSYLALQTADAQNDRVVHLDRHGNRRFKDDDSIFRNVCSQFLCFATYVDDTGTPKLAYDDISQDDSFKVHKDGNAAELRFIRDWEEYDANRLVQKETRDIQTEALSSTCICYESSSIGLSGRWRTFWRNKELDQACEFQFQRNGTGVIREVITGRDAVDFAQEVVRFYDIVQNNIGSRYPLNFNGCSRLAGDSAKSHDDDYDWPSCFSYSSHVFHKNPFGMIEATPMANVQVGDKILNKDGKEVTVVSLAHKKPHLKTFFFHFLTKQGKSLSLTPDHYVSVKICGADNILHISSGALAKLLEKANSTNHYCLIKASEHGLESEEEILSASYQLQEGIIHLTTEDGTLLVAESPNSLRIQANSVAYFPMSPDTFASVMNLYHQLGFEIENENGDIDVSENIDTLLRGLLALTPAR